MSTLQGQSGAGMVPMHISAPKAPYVDMRGVRVKRGVTVSWHGWRAVVLAVRKGHCHVQFLPAFTARTGYEGKCWFPCHNVQVVTP